MLGPVQLCDAPAQAPPHDGLVVEARTRRLLPGAGELALSALIDALPPDLAFGVEVPLAEPAPRSRSRRAPRAAGQRDPRISNGENA